MALTDREVKAAKAREKPYKMGDSGALFLLVTPTGGKLWRFKYRFGGKAKQLALGAYPAVSLAAARIKRDDAKAALREARDPAAAKRLAARLGVAPAETFEALARDWHARNKHIWTERHAGDVLGSLERLVFSAIGSLHVNAITPPLALAALRQIEQNHGGETARRVRQRMSAVFVYAIAHGIGQADPAAIIKRALAPVMKNRMPAVTTLDEARDVLARMEAIPAHPATKLGHRFLALTLVRPDNVNGARWNELDLDTDPPAWRLLPERMKTKEAHVVPLSRQAVELLEAIRPLTGRCPFIFPNARWAHRPMSENAMGYALQRAGLAGVHVPHGWRATFSSIMNERHPADADAIERILAHAPRDKVRGTYNRGSYMARRRELLQEWADILLAGTLPAAELLLGPRRPFRAAA
jgi:integrase